MPGLKGKLPVQKGTLGPGESHLPQYCRTELETCSVLVVKPKLRKCVLQWFFNMVWFLLLELQRWYYLRCIAPRVTVQFQEWD